MILTELVGKKIVGIETITNDNGSVAGYCLKCTDLGQDGTAGTYTSGLIPATDNVTLESKLGKVVGSFIHLVTCIDEGFDNSGAYRFDYAIVTTNGVLRVKVYINNI